MTLLLISELFLFLVVCGIGAVFGGVIAGFISYWIFAHKRDTGWVRKIYVKEYVEGHHS
jgi:hypothetical protein